MNESKCNPAPDVGASNQSQYLSLLIPTIPSCSLHSDAVHRIADLSLILVLVPDSTMKFGKGFLCREWLRSRLDSKSSNL